ncbi:hypothetical protein GF356_10685 [candidate division GN15 bacterium]|nr:hypothetical protein [candidate division GN15 bacterium]
MRQLTALLLACTLILIACVPTTHASGTDPDKSAPHFNRNLETPIVADDGGWIDLKSGQDDIGTVIVSFGRIVQLYLDVYLNLSSPSTSDSEAMFDGATGFEIRSIDPGSRR